MRAGGGVARGHVSRRAARSPASRGPGWLLPAVAGALAAAGCNTALGIDDFNADGCPYPEARICAGKTVQICGDDGTWRDERECAKACNQGSCVAECYAGQRRCAGDAPQECGPDGQWDPPLPACPEELPCSGGVCGAVCVPGDLRCDDGKAQTCDEDGQWREDAVCPQKCTGGVCTECTPNDMGCVNNTPRECDAFGQWVLGDPCGKDFQCSEGTCEGK